MNPLAERIRFWLIRNPKPVKVRCTVDGEQSIVPIVARVSWARVAETVEALGPDLLEALDVDGNTIRATKPEDIELDGDDREPVETSTANPAAPPPLVLTGDPATQALQLVASLIPQQAALIAEAYRQAQDLTGIRNNAAFDRMIDLVEAISRRAELSDKARDAQAKQIDRLTAENIKLSLAVAAKGDGGGDAGGSLLDEIIERFAKAAGMGGDDGGDDETAPPAEPAAANGKGH